MIPGQHFTHLMLLIIESHIVVNFVKILSLIFGHGLRADAIGGREVLKRRALGRVWLFRVALSNALPPRSTAFSSAISFLLQSFLFLLRARARGCRKLRIDGRKTTVMCEDRL